LQVATPQLEIEKTNDLPTVLPGATYTSTVTVTNTGNAPARNVLLSDTVAASAEGVTLQPESAQINNASGVFDEATGVVAAATAVNIPPGEAAVFTLTTRVPVGTSVGQFCNIGRFESENAGSGEVEACIDVPAFAGLQNQFVDAPDPVGAGANLVYTSTLLNEPRSNEAVTDHNLVYTYGVLQNGGAGTFEVVSTRVYVNETPLINSETGSIISVPTSGAELSADQDYTLGASQPGAQNLTINRPLPPGAVIFVVHEVAVPQQVQAGEYTSSFQWTASGADSGTEYQNAGTEPTTVIGQ
jgi:trimeric autotransporter adhesin